MCPDEVEFCAKPHGNWRTGAPSVRWQPWLRNRSLANRPRCPAACVHPQQPFSVRGTFRTPFLFFPIQSIEPFTHSLNQSPLRSLTVAPTSLSNSTYSRQPAHTRLQPANTEHFNRRPIVDAAPHAKASRTQSGGLSRVSIPLEPPPGCQPVGFGRCCRRLSICLSPRTFVAICGRPFAQTRPHPTRQKRPAAGPPVAL